MRRLARALVGATLGVAVAGTGALPVGSSPAGAMQAPAADDRAPALVTVETPDYDFELILHEVELVGGYVRRTDDLDNTIDPSLGPDRYGFYQLSGWDALGGHACLTSGGGEFSWFSDGAPPHAFTYGMTGRQVARVAVVLGDGSRVETTTTRATVGGFRGWMVERPLGTVARVDGFDARGRLVASASPDLPDMSDFAVAPTCRRVDWDR